MQSNLTPIPELCVSYESAQKLKMEAADLMRWNLMAHQPATLRAGFHDVLHRLLGLRQIHHRQRADGEADGDGWPAGHAARRRGCAKELLLRAWLLQGTPRPQHPPHRLRRLRDHQERRHRYLCPDRALHLDPAREDIEQYGAFIEVHVATSIEECERRDRNGLYKLAREGKIKEFTEISDAYEEPASPQIRVETENVEVDNCAYQVILRLEPMGLMAGS